MIKINSKYILDDYFSDYFNAGSKARNDIEECLSDFERLFVIKGNTKYDKIRNLISLNKTINRLRDTLVVIQYPLYVNKNINKFIFKKIFKLQKNNVKSVALIHDINSIRFNKNKIQEVSELNCFNYVISHNDNMTKWLKESGVTSEIINLELFDYYVNTNNDNDIHNGKSYDGIKEIAFAGNLSKEKSGFLYKLKKNSINLILYGNNITDQLKNSDHMNYRGSYKPEELPNVIEAHYGLIWDGDSVDSCCGNTGNYLRYNNPHKLSLYIASGLPIIVWSKAAVAKFVLKNKIGIVVNNLKDIDSILNNITKSDYEIMCQNISKLSEKVKKGYFVKKAISKIEENL